MKTKRYRLNIAPRQAKGFTAYAEVRSIIPPKVKIVDAAEGMIEISTTKNTTLGKYELSVESEDYAPTVMNIEVADKNPRVGKKSKREHQILFDDIIRT